MVLDTSAVVAILLHEPERNEFLLRLNSDRTRLISTVSLVELQIVLGRSRQEPILQQAASFLKLSAIEAVPFDLEQSMMARQAFQRFGKGRHPAALNFGDCITYALAKQTGEPLLCKGNDFIHTDLPLA